MATKGEKISQTKSEKGKKKILEYIKTQKRFNDYIITEYLGYNGNRYMHPNKTNKHCGHQIKIKCLKCGYEDITSSYIFLVKQNQEKMYKCSADKKIIPELNLKDCNYRSFYKEKYAYMWINMNTNCNPNFNNNPRCRYVEKGIKVYKNWLFYESSYHHCKNINAKNYLNYERFIDFMLEAHGFSSEDIKNKTIRIERIDKHGDFEPANLEIRVFKSKKIINNGRKEMLSINSIIYSDDLNRALRIEDLLEESKKIDFNLYATDSHREADPNFTYVKSINKVDNALKTKTDFYKVRTERGYEIIIPDNNKVFLESKKNSNGEVLYYDIGLLQKALEKNEAVLLKLALPRFFTEKSYPDEKILDRNGAILAIFLSSYSDSSINNPIIKLPLRETSIVSKLFLRQDKQLDEMIRNLFGDEVWSDLKVIKNEKGKNEGPDKFIVENKHSKLYKEILTELLSQWLPNQEDYYDANFGFTSGKYLINSFWSKYFLTASPRMLYSFIYHLLKIESYNTSDYYIPYNKNCQLVARDLQDIAFIGNMILVNNKKEGKLYYEKDNKIKQDFPFYDKLVYIEKIDEEELKNFDFANIDVNFNKLVVNGFITYIEN